MKLIWRLLSCQILGLLYLVASELKAMRDNVEIKNALNMARLATSTRGKYGGSGNLVAKTTFGSSRHRRPLQSSDSIGIESKHNKRAFIKPRIHAKGFPKALVVNVNGQRIFPGSNGVTEISSPLPSPAQDSVGSSPINLHIHLRKKPENANPASPGQPIFIAAPYHLSAPPIVVPVPDASPPQLPVLPPQPAILPPPISPPIPIPVPSPPPPEEDDTDFEKILQTAALLNSLKKPEPPPQVLPLFPPILPAMAYPPPARPPMGYPPAASPPMGYPQATAPPMGYPPASSPPMGYPAASSPPMGYPSQGNKPAGSPNMGYPAMGAPTLPPTANVAKTGGLPLTRLGNILPLLIPMNCRCGCERKCPDLCNLCRDVEEETIESLDCCRPVPCPCANSAASLMANSQTLQGLNSLPQVVTNPGTPAQAPTMMAPPVVNPLIWSPPSLPPQGSPPLLNPPPINAPSFLPNALTPPVSPGPSTNGLAPIPSGPNLLPGPGLAPSVQQPAPKPELPGPGQGPASSGSGTLLPPLTVLPPAGASPAPSPAPGSTIPGDGTLSPPKPEPSGPATGPSPPTKPETVAPGTNTLPPPSPEIPASGSPAPGTGTSPQPKPEISRPGSSASVSTRPESPAPGGGTLPLANPEPLGPAAATLPAPKPEISAPGSTGPGTESLPPSKPEPESVPTGPGSLLPSPPQPSNSPSGPGAIRIPPISVLPPGAPQPQPQSPSSNVSPPLPSLPLKPAYRPEVPPPQVFIIRENGNTRTDPEDSKSAEALDELSQTFEDAFAEALKSERRKGKLDDEPRRGRVRHRPNERNENFDSQEETFRNEVKEDNEEELQSNDGSPKELEVRGKEVKDYIDGDTNFEEETEPSFDPSRPRDSLPNFEDSGREGTFRHLYRKPMMYVSSRGRSKDRKMDERYYSRFYPPTFYLRHHQSNKIVEHWQDEESEGPKKIPELEPDDVESQESNGDSEDGKLHRFSPLNRLKHRRLHYRRKTSNRERTHSIRNKYHHSNFDHKFNVVPNMSPLHKSSKDNEESHFYGSQRHRYNRLYDHTLHRQQTNGHNLSYRPTTKEKQIEDDLNVQPFHHRQLSKNNYLHVDKETKANPSDNQILETASEHNISHRYPNNAKKDHYQEELVVNENDNSDHASSSGDGRSNSGSGDYIKISRRHPSKDISREEYTKERLDAHFSTVQSYKPKITTQPETVAKHINDNNQAAEDISYSSDVESGDINTDDADSSDIDFH